jgi:hypothetical protein
VLKSTSGSARCILAATKPQPSPTARPFTAAMIGIRQRRGPHDCGPLCIGGDNKRRGARRYRTVWLIHDFLRMVRIEGRATHMDRGNPKRPDVSLSPGLAPVWFCRTENIRGSYYQCPHKKSCRNPAACKKQAATPATPVR